mgnify:CR=1 FL=1
MRWNLFMRDEVIRQLLFLRAEIIMFGVQLFLFNICFSHYIIFFRKNLVMGWYFFFNTSQKLKTWNPKNPLLTVWKRGSLIEINDWADCKLAHCSWEVFLSSLLIAWFFHKMMCTNYINKLLKSVQWMYQRKTAWCSGDGLMIGLDDLSGFFQP